MNAFAVLCKSCRPDTVRSSVAWGRVWTRSVTFMSSSTTRNGTFSPGTPGRPRTGNFETNAKKDDKKCIVFIIRSIYQNKAGISRLILVFFLIFIDNLNKKNSKDLRFFCSCQINNVQMYKGSQPRSGFKVKLSNFMPLIHFSFFNIVCLLLEHFQCFVCPLFTESKTGCSFCEFSVKSV